MYGETIRFLELDSFNFTCLGVTKLVWKTDDLLDESNPVRKKGSFYEGGASKSLLVDWCAYDFIRP